MEKSPENLIGVICFRNETLGSASGCDLELESFFLSSLEVTAHCLSLRQTENRVGAE